MVATQNRDWSGDFSPDFGPSGPATVAPGPGPHVTGGRVPIGGFVIGFSPIGPLPFPPPTFGLTKTIPSYLYTLYQDDDDLQAFVRAYNNLTQEYVNWFNQIELPYYPSSLVIGGLLDWVAQGLYGMLRPVLATGRKSQIGAFNTWAINTLPFDGLILTGTTYFAVNDDYFKRILTWHVYKGDGRYFNVRWLKRRIMRFLKGVNGTDADVSDTRQVSVSFGTSGQVNILLWLGKRTLTGGAIFDRFALNSSASQFNSTFSSVVNFPPLPGDVTILRDAVNSGAVELPWQRSWVLSIVNPKAA